MSNNHGTPVLRIGRYFAAVAVLGAAIGLIGRALEGFVL